MNTDLDFEDIDADEGGASDDGAHLDGFRMNDADADADDADFLDVDDNGAAIALSAETGKMSRAAFSAMWQTAWNIPGMMLPEYKPLSITDEKSEACDEAAAAIYDLAEMHFPWLIEEKNSTIGSIARAFPFILMQAGAFRAIMAQKRRDRIEAMQPANTNAAPQSKPATEATSDPNSWMDGEAA